MSDTLVHASPVRVSNRHYSVMELAGSASGVLSAGAVMYFELKHWKSKEKKWSTLGWTFVHKESLIRLVDGQPQVRVESQGLHLYEKPMDPRSHFRQASMRKLRPLSDTPDLFIKISEAVQ